MFVVPRTSLIMQTVKSFWANGIQEVGVIQQSHELTDWSKPVQVASVDTLKSRVKAPDFPIIDVVVIDECHMMREFYKRWLPEWDNIPFIGLSATPWTKGLGNLYNELFIAGTTQSLIDQGYLSKFRVFVPSRADLTGIETTAGDYNKGQLAEAMSKPEIVADAVTQWMKHAEGRPTLTFCVDRAHAKKVQISFEDMGIPCGYVDGKMDPDERQEVADKFHTGEYKVVASVGCLTTGVDWDVRCVQLLRPTKSKILFTQIIGRGLRTAPGKDYCLILDHSDTHERLGFVTDIRIETLNGKEWKQAAQPEKREALPKPCTKCSFVKPAKVVTCPNCDYTPERQAGVIEHDGELVDTFTGLQAVESLKKNSPEYKRQLFAELLTLAERKGYKRGWAMHKYQDRYKEFDPSLWQVAPAEPSYISAGHMKYLAMRKHFGRAKHARA